MSATPGLEAALELECRALGWAPERVLGGVEIPGKKGLHQEANLWLRTASRVLLRLGQVDASTPNRLRESLAAVTLASFRTRGQGVHVTAVAHRSKIRAVAAEEAASQAWKLETASAEGEGLTVQLRIDGERGTVSVDTSGELLHRRGYRQEVSRAPLRETLAAGVLILSGFTGQAPLVDPMCGSGTLAIEAALMALGRAPGVARTFAFQRWPSFEEGSWRARVAAARAQEKTVQGPPIFARDLNAGALGTARRNARRAGVSQLISFDRCDVADLPRPEGPDGWLATNPPYGKRVGSRGALAPLYEALGRTLRERFKGWHAALLVADERATAGFPLTNAGAFPLENGGLHCVLVTGTVR